MKMLHDKGKKAGIYRFLKFSSSKKQLDVTDEDLIVVILGILIFSVTYSFKYKCWINKFNY